MDINCLLFNGFETLDLFGPVEVFSKVEEYNLKYYSTDGENIVNAQNMQIITENISSMDASGILLVPGGKGTRTLINDGGFINTLKTIAEKSTWCLTVCTGSALLAKTGLLDNCNATSNKLAFKWVESTREKVHWKYNARWVVDKKYYTSSGISAGIDMALGFISDRFDKARADNIAKIMEYKWNSDKDDDVFSSHSRCSLRQP
ncbi:dimethyladenosine transferase [Spirochaetia bacterium]|nr:dimethyladenosine transferase [Spirochaetia bacterium]